METNYLTISEKELFEIIKTFYTNGDAKEIHVEKDLRIINDELSLNIYLVKDENKYIVTQEDLEYVFKFYLHSCGLEFVDFKLIGGIHHAGYYFDSDTPHFDGVRIQYIDKSKERKLEL